MTYDLYFHTTEFLRIFFTYCVKYETVSSNKYISRTYQPGYLASRAVQRIKYVSTNCQSLSP